MELPSQRDPAVVSGVKIMLAVIVALWVIELVDLVLPGRPLDGLGIRPRSLGGLVGILFAPFLHGGFLNHLAPNTIPLFVLGVLVSLGGLKEFAGVTAFVAVVAGLGSWLFGQSGSVHIGASGVIFGYLGFLVSRGFFDRKVKWIVLSIVVGMLYSGFLLVLLRVQAGVSWSGHFFGFASGVLAAWQMRVPRPTGVA